MEKRKHFTVRLTVKQWKLYHMLGWRKKRFYDAYEKKFSKEEREKHREVFNSLKSIPPSLTGIKKTAVSPEGVNRELMEGFAGYLAHLLTVNNGDVDRAYRQLIEELKDG